MSDAPELLPCPFCGGESDIDHDHTVEENHAYGCRKCGIWFDTFNSDKATAAWNTRAAPTTAQIMADPRVKKLVEALEPFAVFAQSDSFDKLPDDTPMTQGSKFARRQVTASDFIAARAALAALKEKP